MGGRMTNPHEKIDQIVANAPKIVVPLVNPKGEKVGASGEVCPDGITAPHPPSRPAEDEPSREPRPMGFDVDQLNQEFALVLLGSKAVVFLEQPHAHLEERKRILSVEAFGVVLVVIGGDHDMSAVDATGV